MGPASAGLSALIDAEPACASSVRSVQFSVRTDGAPAFARSFPVLSADDLPIDVAIDIPSPPGAKHEAEAVFTLLGAAPGAPGDLTVLVSFAGGSGGRVSLVLPCTGAGGAGGAGGSPPIGALCSCAGVENNFCQHAPGTADCPMTMPGGYCDPNGDGSYVDGDWTKGFYDYAAACAP